jgi:hypothetical protein
MPERIESLQERVDFLLHLDQSGVQLTEVEEGLLKRYSHHVKFQEDRAKARTRARAAVLRARSGLPHPSFDGAARASHVGAGAAVSAPETFDGRSASGVEYRARLAQYGLTTAFHEDRLSPPRPQRSPALEAGQRRREGEQAAKRAATAERLAAGAIDGKTATAAQATARYKALGLELPVGVVLRDAGKPLPPPNYPVNGPRGR